MIKLNELADILQELLNDNEYGFNFKVFDSIGKYQEGLRQNANEFYKFINVMLTQNSCDVSTLKNGMKMQTFGLSVAYLIPMLDNDNTIVETELQLDQNNHMVENVVESFEGNAEMLANLEEFFGIIFGQPYHFEWESDNDKFTAMMLFTQPKVSDRDVLAGVGFALTMAQGGFVYLVQDGINERNLDYYLDGELIPYDSVTQYYNPTTNGYVDNGNGEVENTELQFQKTWAFVFPSMYDSIGKHCIEHINGENKPNTAHFLKHQVWIGWLNNAKVIKKTYYDLVLFAQSSLQAQATKNASFSVSFVKCTKDFSMLDFPSGFVLYNLQGQSVSVASATANAKIIGWDANTNTFVDFGDGTSHDVSGMLLVASDKVNGIPNILIAKEY